MQIIRQHNISGNDETWIISIKNSGEEVGFQARLEACQGRGSSDRVFIILPPLSKPNAITVAPVFVDLASIAMSLILQLTNNAGVDR